ncbi:MAG: HEAT repeat domain-containing protein, partial [Planctomycetota bacterium]
MCEALFLCGPNHDEIAAVAASGISRCFAASGVPTRLRHRLTMKDKNRFEWHARGKVVQAVSTFAGNPEIRKFLISRIVDENEDEVFRCFLIRGISSHRENREVQELLLYLVDHEIPDIQEFAIDGLAKGGLREAHIPICLRLLNTKDAGVVRSAATALFPYADRQDVGDALFETAQKMQCNVYSFEMQIVSRLLSTERNSHWVKWALGALGNDRNVLMQRAAAGGLASVSGNPLIRKTGPSGKFVGSVEFSAKENRLARQRTVS